MKAVILAGGKGTRLRPYTTTIPKPLMPIGDKAILEIVIEQLKKNGIKEIIMAVGYSAELIMAYFGNGEKHGIKITYSKEDKPLGTAAPLANIDLKDTFLVMNGDILTNLDYKKLIDFHKKNNAVITVAVNKRNVKIDFGVIKTESNEITKYTEKPTLDYSVSMGINVVDPKVLKHIKKGKKLDFPELIQLLIENKEKVMAYPSDDYWLDIGRHDDYERAQEEFKEVL